MALERFTRSARQFEYAVTTADNMRSDDELKLLNRQGELYSQVERTYEMLGKRHGFNIRNTVVAQIDEPNNDTQYLPANFLKVLEDLQPDRMTISIKKTGLVAYEYKMMIQLMRGKISGPQIEIDAKDYLFELPKAAVRYLPGCIDEPSWAERELKEKYPHDGKFPKDFDSLLSHTEFGQSLMDWALTSISRKIGLDK
jgi:hypothetical protein